MQLLFNSQTLENELPGGRKCYINDRLWDAYKCSKKLLTFYLNKNTFTEALIINISNVRF